LKKIEKGQQLTKEESDVRKQPNSDASRRGATPTKCRFAFAKQRKGLFFVGSKPPSFGSNRRHPILN
jgi:hypothetical protein